MQKQFQIELQLICFTVKIELLLGQMNGTNLLENIKFCLNLLIISTVHSQIRDRIIIPFKQVFCLKFVQAIRLSALKIGVSDVFILEISSLFLSILACYIYC